MTLLSTAPCFGGDVLLFDDGTLALWARADPPGVVEPPVPLSFNGNSIGNFKAIEAYDQVAPATSCFPLTYVDLIANTYLRGTYQKEAGTTGALGTSVVGTPSFRTSSGLQFIPSPSQANVLTGGPSRVEIGMLGSFRGSAAVESHRSFPDPAVGDTRVELAVCFQALQEIELDASQLGNDAFRMLTVSSMFSNEQTYDANVICYEDATGNVHALELDNNTPRGAHLFPPDTELGSWLMLVKQSGSSWFPDSPSVRVDIMTTSGLTGRLGIQGFLAETLDPNADSLSVWIEWLDAPPVIPADAHLEMGVLVNATGEGELDPNFASTFVAVLVGLDDDPAHLAASDLNCDGNADGQDIARFVEALLGT